MKLSIVIICWNDLKVIRDCLQSIYSGTLSTDFEVIVSDNGSSDRSIEMIRRDFPQVRLIENGANLGFAKGNNVGIRASVGEYVLILNPDTIIHPGALDAWVKFAERYPKAGAFGCRVLNPDGSYQISARPFPTVCRAWIAALCLRPLAYLSGAFTSDTYFGWRGDTERTVDWQSGCCLMVRAAVLKSLNGFDEQFFYHFEEVDLCRRVWASGHTIMFAPKVTITHLGGQSVGRFPLRFELEKQRNRYRFFYKHYGKRGVRQSRLVLLAELYIRRVAYGIQRILRPTEALNRRLETYRVCLQWNRRIDPVDFVERGEEPALAPLPAQGRA